MLYDLSEIEAVCWKCGLMFRRKTDGQLEVEIASSLNLLFANQREPDEDTYLGFVDTPWHTHGNLILMTEEDSYVEYSPVEVVQGLVNKDILVVTSRLDGKLDDRWLIHRLDKLDLKYVGDFEELCVSSCRLSNGGKNND